MTPATTPPAPRDGVRMLVVDPIADAALPACFTDLPALLRSGDLLVVNDAATLPASLSGRTLTGDAVEVRLIGPVAGDTWRAVLLGEGDWRTPTERRPPPPALACGETMTFDASLAQNSRSLLGTDRYAAPARLMARVVDVSSVSPRLVVLRFDCAGAALWDALYALGKPIQYAYVGEPLPLWSVQTVFAARPWAAEMPSAGRPFTWEMLGALRRGGVRLERLTHAAGLSATGDAAIDAVLPLPERYDIPARTVAAIEETRATGGRVIAVGTTVVRALEGSAAAHGSLTAGCGETDLVIGSDFEPGVVDALLSGVHAPGESHWHVLSAFAGDDLLRRAATLADQLGFRGHELGDSTLILPGAASAAPSRQAAQRRPASMHWVAPASVLVARVARQCVENAVPLTRRP
jgi:S-adenosylmethionine:tRNA ribosyltransferase-isomerase